MQPEDATFRLADGEIVRLGPDDLRAVYDGLWVVALTQRGAITAAARVLDARRWTSPRPIELDDYETAAFRLAQTQQVPPA